MQRAAHAHVAVSFYRAALVLPLLTGCYLAHEPELPSDRACVNPGITGEACGAIVTAAPDGVCRMRDGRLVAFTDRWSIASCGPSASDPGALEMVVNHCLGESPFPRAIECPGLPLSGPIRVGPASLNPPRGECALVRQEEAAGPYAPFDDATEACVELPTWCGAPIVIELVQPGADPCAGRSVARNTLVAIAFTPDAEADKGLGFLEEVAKYVQELSGSREMPRAIDFDRLRVPARRADGDLLKKKARDCTREEIVAARNALGKKKRRDAHPLEAVIAKALKKRKALASVKVRTSKTRRALPRAPAPRRCARQDRAAGLSAPRPVHIVPRPVHVVPRPVHVVPRPVHVVPRGRRASRGRDRRPTGWFSAKAGRREGILFLRRRRALIALCAKFWSSPSPSFFPLLLPAFLLNRSRVDRARARSSVPVSLHGFPTSPRANPPYERTGPHAGGRRGTSAPR